MDLLFNPLAAFLVYLAFAGLLTWLGKRLAGPARPSAAKSSLYSSGEAGPQQAAVPGYRPFLVVALFFAVLHLGVLVLATGVPAPVSVVFLAGLMVTLLALILG
jgi:NADH:ubiquinone oxidoreductase subunit 3 (subunit A)